jgi:hypothetical protein
VHSRIIVPKALYTGLIGAKSNVTDGEAISRFFNGIV